MVVPVKECNSRSWQYNVGYKQTKQTLELEKYKRERVYLAITWQRQFYKCLFAVVA
jgi:hypothetical protein